MSEFRVAYRYALALISVAEEQGAMEELHRDFQSLEKLIGQSRDMLLFLKSPVVNAEKKTRVLKEILDGHVGKQTMRFLLLVTSKGREGLLPEMIRQFYRLRNEHLGIVNITARTAVSFTEAQEKQLIVQLERATKKKVLLQFLLDKSLLGGFTVQHDDTVWDASVRRQLELLREQFAHGTA